jgi:Lon protease-like protein
MEEIGLFPLGVVLLPTERIPLHIFEPRYRELIGECLAEEREFGLILADDDGLREVGTRALVTEVLERFDDGRMNVVVTGEQPFRVLERFEEPDYPAGEVEPLSADDEPSEDDPEAADMARQAFAELVRRVSGDTPDDLDIETEDAYGIAARVELPVETKQALLEQRAESERMRMLGNALRALVAAVARSSEIAERAKMNGKVIVG